MKLRKILNRVFEAVDGYFFSSSQYSASAAHSGKAFQNVTSYCQMCGVLLFFEMRRMENCCLYWAKRCLASFKAAVLLIENR